MCRPLNVLSLCSWVILLFAIAVSFRPLTPVIWDDTPAFVESSFRTLETRRPTVVDARDPGYPIILAATFAVGGDLGSVVLLQEVSWAVLVIALAATAQTVTRSAYALGPIIVIAMYPGLLMYRSIVMAETLYTVFLNLAVLALVMATAVKQSIRCWLVATAILTAAVAACLKSQGIPVVVAVVPFGVWIGWPYARRGMVVIGMSCAIALALLATSSRVGLPGSDKASTLFVGKTLFCNHVNIALASEAAKREIAMAARDYADAMFARLTADLASKRQSWPTLGFYGDECVFDTHLDQYLARDNRSSAEIAATYRRIFLAAILDHPLLYLGKIIHQMLYGAWFSWPPHGLSPTVSNSTNAVIYLSEIMKQHGFPAPAIDVRNRPVAGWMLSDLGMTSVYLFRGLSAAFMVAILFSIVIIAKRQRPEFSARASIVITLWTASILTSAAAVTLDIWRYIVPSAPMVALLLSMVCVELFQSIIAYRQKA